MIFKVIKKIFPPQAQYSLLIIHYSLNYAAWFFHSAESAIFVSEALFRKAMIRYLYGISG